MPARSYDRAPNELRPCRIERDIPTKAPGAVLVHFGETAVLCTATLTDSLPTWLQGSGHGWLTAEYAMHPAATGGRKARDGRSGRTDGRSIEIQRLIGRSLRMAVHTDKLPECSIWIDCDVLRADGGTRTAALTGAWVALHDLLVHMRSMSKLSNWPLRDRLAAVSVGLVGGEPYLDLDYSEDSRADADMNVVMLESGELVEVQVSAEKRPLTRAQHDALLDLATAGCRELFQVQRRSVET
ncbi:MAG TPA: ribonuclease PH [Planctomycetota bacterium]|nr:ribonuclease PH [Planctomycetota bacterium]